MDKDGLIPQERIVNRIFLIREKKVMLDGDLAELYRVKTRALVQAVKRNADRFPGDFMFRLSSEEALTMRSQFVIASKRNIRYQPYAFTELGVAMLSSVLNSKRAIQVNIQIMRAFTRLRDLLATHKDLREKVEELERKYTAHDEQFKVVFEAIRQLLNPPEEPRNPIGFRQRN
jgi:hypothetical protein